jgi:hypothetical protein
VVEIEHANPYYDDSYAVNSANLGFLERIKASAPAGADLKSWRY